MTAATKTLRDDAARRTAIGVHDRSILVEAGAGSGKTAVMAGRIAAMLAEGIAPKSIAAVTFTELAASELLIRVRDFVADLAAGKIPTELRIAFPDGLSANHSANLAAAASVIDEITCSTIHGFCQRLIKPYPVEADIDPGASVMDRNQADLAFIEIVETWLREQLSGGEGGIIAEMVLHNPDETVGLIHKIVANLRKRRTVSAPPVSALAPHLGAFHHAVDGLMEFIRTAPAVEDETAMLTERFAGMAAGLDSGPVIERPVGLVRLLVTPPHPDLCTKTGSFLAYKKKGKWVEAAKREGLAKTEGERLNIAADAHYAACCQTWQGLVQNVASRVLCDLIAQVQPVLARFRDYKRSAAQLDFDDLIFAARDLLRDHDDVRRSLAARFAHVLVDEFQDTDPLQTEIFWRLCGEPPAGVANADWSAFTIRPGALFLVGDPKQAIYRFRGADVSAYVRARDAYLAQDPGSVLAISTNFRSCAPILTYVNDRFEALLSSEGQPGFTALDPFHADRGEALCVAALDVAVADENGKASAEQQRDGEADAIAQMCARLIGSEMILDRRSGASRPCRPGDIALLAPTGSDLWRYEEALERHGIPVATQAGKGLFRRQEIQDLIALTRVLADRRDTLALGALLRGPLVGLTEEELLDIIWALPRAEDDPERLPRLDLGVEVEHIGHPLARSTIETLQALYRQTNSTAPHDLLSQAIDALRVRPILLERHRGQAERALANVDLYLSLTTSFAVRGLRAFAETMTAAWTDEARAVEGRPDAQEEAVALYTMHAAKGLEWPIVVPINTMTGIMAPESAVTDRDSDTFYCPVFGVKPLGYDAARDAEKAELDRERIRLWYVAATRARELLVLPRLDAAQSKSAWISLLDLSLAELPALDLSHLPPELDLAAGGEANDQTRDDFAAEAASIVARQRRLIWLAPSRDESADGPVLTPEAVEIWAASEAGQPDDEAVRPNVQGGRERGLILHKLLEEVLTGETPDHAGALSERARALIGEIGRPVMADPSQGLSPDELAGCVVRTLALPEIAELRATLAPELAVYAAVDVDGVEQATVGIADATGFDNAGRPTVVIDWKSDVQPTAETLNHYRAQVRAYLDMTGTDRGLIVLVTTGQVITVTPTPAPWPPEEKGTDAMLTRATAKAPEQDDLFCEEVTLMFPALLALEGRLLGSAVRQQAVPSALTPCRLKPFTVRRVSGFEANLKGGETLKIISAKTAASLDADLVLLVPGAITAESIREALERGEGRWLHPKPIDPAALSAQDMQQRLTGVTASWEDAFHLREGRAATDDKPLYPGLRRPQIGALHAALAHATRSTDPATIVMPTGTGKTETMLALNARQRFERLLVVVPTDALREQIAAKFETFGVLKAQSCLDASALFPVVTRLTRIPTSIAEVDQIFDSANVIVTTMHIAGRAEPPVQEHMAARASALFIDEAHHIGARTWASFRGLFAERTPPIPVVQFTATPFREDGRRIDGEFIYTYPLKKAQQEGYFKPIRFEAVFGLDQLDADQAIIDKLGDVLAADLDAGLNHLAMARCSTIERAKHLHRLYTLAYPDYRPVIVHSQQSLKERRENLAALRRFDSRIIVCVDMLGEGFDLPELKIAALHDHHKSVAVTIQFVGRFTRQDPRLGDATVIANTGVDDVDRSLAKLYAEDADWNALVEALSSAKIERQVRRAEMFKGFSGDLSDIPLQTLEPKMNAVVYRTACDAWDPFQAEELYDTGVYLGMKLNAHKRVAIFVTRAEEQARWTTAQQAVNVTWDLHMLHWDQASGLLYISSSAKCPFDRLAKAVCGETARRVEGEEVFRSLHGFKRLILRNLGLTHHQGRGVRYSMYMGVDVADGLDSAKSQSRIKNNIFATGFLDGMPASRGCSAKGKFWSSAKVRDLTDWVDWCQDVGRTVNDPSITTDGVFKSAMRPRQINERPTVPPVAIHWPESLIMQIEERIEISFGDQPVSFTECDIELLDNARTGPLRFAVRSDDHSAEFEIVFSDGGARYPQRSGPKATIKIGSKIQSLSESFADDSPQIDFGDGSLLIYSHLYSLPEGETVEPYPVAKIEAWDWSKANIRVESQGTAKRADSVQRTVIEALLTDPDPYDVIFDDDGKGEIADVVALRITDSVVSATLFHCKYSGADTPGARLSDLYEVCGQAQKSARWRDRPNRMLQHMLKREQKRRDRGLSSRIETGSAAAIKKLKAGWQDYRFEYDVRIVQPGLSRKAIGEEGLHLLAGVETYLLETRGMRLRVIGSD